MAVLRQLRQPVAAALIGISPRSLRDSVAPRAGDGTYDGLALVAWAAARERERLLKRNESEKWLQEIRRQKALRARRQNAIEEARLVEGDQVRQVLEASAAALRAELEAIERAHGPDVGKALREAFARAEATWNERIARPQRQAAAATEGG